MIISHTKVLGKYKVIIIYDWEIFLSIFKQFYIHKDVKQYDQHYMLQYQ